MLVNIIYHYQLGTVLMQYLSNHWSDLPQTVNLGLYDQCKFS